MSKINESDFKTMSLNELFSTLSGPSRINRKNAAKYLAADIKENPKDFKKYIPNLIDALDRPEAQTRWECLNSLSNLVKYDQGACKKAIPGAEEALFDERTSFVRVSAIRFLCRYASLSPKNSSEVWPIIKDGLEQFNGEIEYDDMLNYLIVLSSAELDSDVKKDFRAFVRGSIENVDPTTKLRLERIQKNLYKKQKNASKSSFNSKSADSKTINNSNSKINAAMNEKERIKKENKRKSTSAKTKNKSTKVKIDTEKKKG